MVAKNTIPGCLLATAYTCLYSLSGIYYFYHRPVRKLKGSYNCMTGVQHPSNSVRPSIATTTRRSLLFRIVRSVLISIAITFLLSFIELSLFWLFNPFSLLGRDRSSQPFAALGALIMHLPLLWLVPLIEVIGISVATIAVMKPLTILAYVRDTQKALERYRTLYTSLPSLAAIYKTPVAYYEYTPDPSTSKQEQSLSLDELLVQLADTSLLLLGAAGSGKSLALQHCHYLALQQRSAIWRLLTK